MSEPTPSRSERAKEADRINRALRLSDAEVQRRQAHDYAGELLALPGFERMERPEPGCIILNVGITGSGKSTWVKRMLAEWMKEPTFRCVAWDHFDELSIYGRETPYAMLGPLTKRVTIDALLADVDMLDEPELRLAVVPTGRGEDGRAQDFRDFVAALELDDEERGTEDEERQGILPYLLVIEEVTRVAEYAASEFKAIASAGRHTGVSVCANAQWAAGIPHEMRRQSRRVVAHAQTWDVDIDRLAEPMGRELAEKVKALPNHQRITWDRDNAAQRGSTAA